jgi:hypothetical protein
MTRGNRAGEVVIITIALAAACTAALAQYSNSDPRNSNPEYQQRQNELQQQENDKPSNAPPAAAALGVAPPAKVAAAGSASAVVDGAAFRCRDRSRLHVTWCQGTVGRRDVHADRTAQAWNRHADRTLSHRGACAGLRGRRHTLWGPMTSRSLCADRTVRCHPQRRNHA